MNWYQLRVSPGGSPGPDGYLVKDERHLDALAASYRDGGYLVVQTYSLVRGEIRDNGPVAIVSPHLVAIRPTSEPSAP
jgi:hypothetical protein